MVVANRVKLQRNRRQSRCNRKAARLLPAAKDKVEFVGSGFLPEGYKKPFTIKQEKLLCFVVKGHQ